MAVTQRRTFAFVSMRGCSLWRADIWSHLSEITTYSVYNTMAIIQRHTFVFASMCGCSLRRVHHQHDHIERNHATYNKMSPHGRIERNHDI